MRLSELPKLFSKEEKFRLTDQLIRGSRLITANVAESHDKFLYQENIQYCRMSRVSLSECMDHLICVLDEKYITQVELDKIRSDYELVSKLINGYINYLQKQKNK